MKILLVAVNAKYTHMNPALYSIRAFAGVYGECMDIAEYTINQYPRDVLKELFKKRPDIIGFSCYIWNMRFIDELLEDIGKVLPSAIILLGGPEAAHNTEELFRKHECVDGIFTGEGESSWKKLAETLSEYEDVPINIKDIGVIPGLLIRGEEEMPVKETKMMELDDIPFIFDDMSLFENRMIYYETSRGCPFRCSYCLSSIDKTMRFKSLDKVYPQLQHFLDCRVKIVKFTDRTFNANHEHAMGIWRYLSEHDNGVTRFHFEIEADLLGEKELDFLETVRPGLFQLEIGVQSANPETLASVNRHSDISRIRSAVKRLKANGNIPVHVDLIAGLPYEGLNSFRDSFNEVYGWGADELQLGFLKVLKGTEIEKKAEQYGLIYESSPPYEVLSTNWLSYEEIIHLKDLEEQLERYGNSGSFRFTLREFEKYFSDAFAMYEYIAQYYRLHSDRFRRQSRMSSYEMLRDIISVKLDELNDDFAGFDLDMRQIGHFDALLIIDMYAKEKLKVRPGFIPGADKQRRFEREYKKAYGTGENVHVENFEFDVNALICGNIIRAGSGTVIFTYEGQGAAVNIDIIDEEGNMIPLETFTGYDIA